MEIIQAVVVTDGRELLMQSDEERRRGGMGMNIN